MAELNDAFQKCRQSLHAIPGVELSSQDQARIIREKQQLLLQKQ